MNTIIHNINGLQIEQRCEDGYINASAMCVAYGKDVLDWLKTDNAWKLVVALAEKLRVQPIKYKSSENGTVISTKILITYPTLVVLKQGLLENGGGIWIHYKLAVFLAIWINAGLVPLVLDWVEYWLTTCQDSNKPSASQQFSSIAKAYIESSQALNRTIHTAIHQQTDSLRLALNALVSSDDLTVSDSKSISISDNTQTDTDNLLSTQEGAPLNNTDEVLKKNTSPSISNTYRKHGEGSGNLSWGYANANSTKKKPIKQLYFEWEYTGVRGKTYVHSNLREEVIALNEAKAPVAEILDLLTYNPKVAKALGIV
jgi:KilA-N domain